MQLRPALAPLALLAFCALAWSGAVLRGGFAFDDLEVIEANPVVQGSAPLLAAFERDYWHHREDAGHYRPLASLSLRADHALWGLEPQGYHATSVLLQLGAVLLAVLVWRRAASERAAAVPWCGLAVFALHPALADSVAWISGRTSTISALGGLSGALALQLALARGARGLAPGLAAAFGLLAALCAKEDGLVFALVYALLVCGRGRRVQLAVGLGILAALAAWLALRAHALGAALPHAPHAPLAAEALGVRLLVAGRALLYGLGLAVMPLDHPPNWSAAAGLDPDSASFVPLLGALGLVLWCVCFALGGRALWRGPTAGARLLGASAALVAACVAPLMQIIPAGEVFAPRFLYLPLLLGAPLWDAGLRASGSARLAPPARGILAGFLLIGLCALDWHRAEVYADRMSYRRAVLRWFPEDVRSWNDLGVGLAEAGQTAQARAAWRRATALDDSYGRAWSNLGAAALEAGELAEAEGALARALERGEANPVLHVNSGRLQLELDAPEQARRHYERATELAPGMGAAWRGLALAYEALQRADDARRALERALELDPDDRRALRMLDELEPAPSPN